MSYVVRKNSARTTRFNDDVFHWLATGDQAEPVTTVQVEACPAMSTSATWSVFTGGTWVASPACVPLVIRSQGRQVNVLLAIGVVCDESLP